MDADIRELIQTLHQHAPKTVLAVTGGGASAIGWLLAVPGASRVVLEAVVPYDQSAMDDWLGTPLAGYCSDAAARRLAERARERAAWLAPGEAVVGIGCTASLASDRPKKGAHRIHVAASTSRQLLAWSLTLAKDQRDRESEDAIAGRLVINALATAAGLKERLAIALLPDEQVQTSISETGLLAEFAAGRLDAVCVEPDGKMHTERPREPLLVCGSFNPLHHGHLGLADAAARRMGRAAAFELSIANPEKGVIALEQLRQRAGQFAWRAPLWLTHAPTFDRKARLFPGAIFVVGVDTAERIVQTRFYGDSVEAMRGALVEIRTCGGRFLVAGRVNTAGAFVSLDELGIAAESRDLFTALPADEFRADVSSTALRHGSRDG